MSASSEQVKSLIIQTCYLLFGALCISTRSGYSYAPAVLLLMSLPVLCQKQSYQALDKNSGLLFGILLLYPLVHGISILLDGGTIKEFDRPSKVIMGAAILLFCLRNPPRFKWLMLGIATGAITAGSRALFDRLVTGYGRAFEWMVPIQGGDISMTLGLLSLCGVMWSIKTTNRGLTIYFALASMLGVLGSILSGSRGGWVLFPVILFVIYRIFKDWFSPKVKLGMGLALCLLVAFCLTPQSGVPTRIAAAKSDISLYLSGQNKNTSLGHRFEIWKSSVDSFIEKPLFGWGYHGVRQSQEQQYKQGLITKAAYDFNSHAHNQFLDEMAKRGIIGLSALLALLLIPLYLFKQYLKPSFTPETRTLAAAGVVVVLSTIDYSLSQAFLYHSSGLVFYCASIIFLYSAVRSQQPTHGKSLL